MCVCREGVSHGFNSEALPAPMLLSNSLYPDVAPQMMAGIIMKWIMMEDADRAVDMEDPSHFGRSGEMCEEHLAFDSSLKRVSRRQNTHTSFVLLP